MDEHDRNKKVMDFLAVAFVLGGGFGMLICCGAIAYVIHNDFMS